MARPERRRARDLADTLVWGLREMNPHVETLPENPDGLEWGVTVEILPGLRAILFPHGAVWRGLVVAYNPATGQVQQTLEHSAHVETDEEAPQWAAGVIRDILAPVAAGQGSADVVALAQQRLAKVEALIPRL